MVKASKLDRLSDQVITALLEKHACPLPFHAVRALFTQELDGMIKQVRELSIIAEKEMNIAIQSCKRARAQMLETYAAEKPVLH